MFTRPGLSEWRCDKEIFSVGEEDEEAQAETEARLPFLIRSMHSPGKIKGKELGLEKCLRFLPQDSDTGGFFVALLGETLCEDFFKCLFSSSHFFQNFSYYYRAN